MGESTRTNKRFEELIRKYRENTLDQAQFREFITMLEDPRNLHLLDDALAGYWQDMPVPSGNIHLPEKDREMPGRKGSRQLLFKIAASFLILAAAATFYLTNRAPAELYTSYKTGFSEILNVELPDGSKVTLNANSDLKWNNRWKKNGARLVRLEGEAFFDIRSLENKMAFTVETGAVSVEVTGTSFNVNNRGKQVEVYLDEGKVNLHIQEDFIAMKPGEKIKYDARQNKMEKTLNESMTSSASWKNGVLNFRDMTFRDVLAELKNIYGKSFQCGEEELLSKTIYLGVPYSSWETVKQALELSLDVKITEKEGIVEITSD